MLKTRLLQKGAITEYTILVCALFIKIWCGFINQAFLFTVGGSISVAVDLALCGYMLLNCQRKRDKVEGTLAQNNFLAMWLIFSVFYVLIYLLGGETLPQVSLWGVVDIPKQIYNAIFSVLYLCPLVWIVKNTNENERVQISNLILVIFFAVALANLITAITNPELVKNEAYNEGTSLFTLGYSGSYNLMLITPILLYKLGVSKHKLLMAIIFACNLLSVFYGGYFIAVLGTIVALLMYWILSIKNKVLVLVLSVFLLACSVAFVVSGALTELMRYLADTVEIDVLRDRFDDLARYLSGETNVGEEDTTFRLQIYQNTFLQFLKHPILGNFVFGNYQCHWDHATILDLLSVGGVLLCGLFFAVIAYGYKFACAFIKSTRGRNALLAAIIAYLFVAAINPVLSYRQLGLLFVVAPIVMGGVEDNENTDTSSL